MEYPSKIVEEAVGQFAKLPGIGKKTALRLVLHLLKQDEENAQHFSESILKLKSDLHYCKQCNNISDHDLCNICADNSRNGETVCVVEDLRDVMAIENTNQFRGKYHVLTGLISPIDGIGPEDLSIDNLLKRVAEGDVKELIFALAATMEGDTTTFYISKKVKDFNVKITTIARGIAIGGELEYADEITLGRSIISRIPYKV
ncbi:MAG: recombination protein RecR [Sphingobacteriales bacterium]|nr:MAG: recombination protein RecR [Sphingobacteriales bacterium]